MYDEKEMAEIDRKEGDDGIQMRLSAGRGTQRLRMDG